MCSILFFDEDVNTNRLLPGIAMRNVEKKSNWRNTFCNPQFLCSILVFFAVSASEPVRAQQVGQGVGGWSTVQAVGPSLVLGSPDAACRAQWQSYNPGAAYYGAFSTGNPSVYGCSFGSLDFGCGAGSTGCGSANPSIVWFTCQAGYQANGYQNCTPVNEVTPANNYCPKVGDPIVLSDGAKIESVLDYATGDGQFFIRRYYRSLPQIYNLQSYNGIFGSAAGGWRFGFNMELHLYGTSGDYPTLYLPNGLAYDFTRSGNNFAFTIPLNQRTHYSLSYVGTPPANWESITGAATQWKVMDADNRVWILQTFSQPNSGAYNVARPISVTMPGGYAWNFSYDAYGAVTKIADSYGRSFGLTWNYQYFKGLVVPGTQSTPFMPVPESVASITLPGGGLLRYSYNPPLDIYGSQPSPVIQLLEADQLNSAGTLINSTKYQYGNATFQEFLTGETDARGVVYSTTAYDAVGRASSTTLGGGVDQYSVAYIAPTTAPPNQLVRNVTNPLGKVTEYHYSHTADGNATLLTNVIGDASANCPASAAAITYDANNYPATKTDEEGRVTAFVNDIQGRPTSITRGSGTAQAATTTISWNASFNLPNQIVEPNLTTTLTIGSTGLVTQIQKLDTTTQTVPYATKGQTRTWGYGYNSTGRLTSVAGPLSGAVVGYAYNASGNIQTITDELGHVTTATAWNGRGQPTSVTDPNGVVTNLTYEPVQGLLSGVVVDATGSPATTTIAYDLVGDVTKITLPNGVYESYAYDAARRLTTIVNSAGETVSYVRDANGDITSTTITLAGGATAYTVTRAFDQLGRLIKSIGALSQTYNFGYDRTDNLTSVTDPRSNVFSYGFDPLNRLIKETDEVGAVVNLSRDGRDNITGYQDPRSIVSAYVRNGFGEAVQEVSPDRGTSVYVRDALGHVTQKTDPRGVVTNYTYDLAGRLTAKTYAGQTQYWQSFNWDATASNNKGIGQLVGVYSETGLNWRAFDAQGRIWVDYRTNNPAPALATFYYYDAAGNITGMTYPSGRYVGFARDAMGRISSIVTQQNSGASVQTIASSIAWNPYGPITSLTFGNGLISKYTLDTSYRVTRVQTGTASAPGSTLDRSLSWTGDIVNSIIDNDNPGTTPPFTYGAQSQSFTYTPARRLATASGYYGALSFTYDGVGNRLSETTNGVLSSYAYPMSSNRLSSVATSTSTRAFTYDAAGNILTDSRVGALGMTFQYDVEGRLSKAWQTAAPANGGVYGYDALNRLASRTVTSPASATTLYVHDINNHIIAETNTAGQTLREYVWLNDLPVAVVDNVNTASPALYFVHSDHLGRPARMTAQNQSWAWDVIYDPFGNVSYSWSNPETMNIRFPGQWFQLETGLAYNWHRHYDATLGRYVQPDPLGLKALMSDGPSAYGYVGGNPLAYVDAEGTGPIGRTIGGWVGSIIAGALGLKSGPGDVFIVQSGRFIGGEIGSAIEDLTAQADERYPKKKGKCGKSSYRARVFGWTEKRTDYTNSRTLSSADHQSIRADLELEKWDAK